MEIHCWDVEFASDSVGAALKRTADNLVNKGTEIPDAAELFAVLQNTETTIKLFFDSEEEVEQAVLEMPKDLPGSSVRYEDASGGYCSPWRAYR